MKNKEATIFQTLGKSTDRGLLLQAKLQEKEKRKQVIEEALRDFEEQRKSSTEIKETKVMPRVFRKPRVIGPPTIIAPEKYRVISAYKYFLGGGNNFELIDRVLKTRPWWENIGRSNIMINLFITQCTRKGEFEKYSDKGNLTGSIAKCINRFEGFKELTDKDLMFINMFKYCEVNVD